MRTRPCYSQLYERTSLRRLNILYDAEIPREAHYRRNCFDSGGYIERENIRIQGVLGGGMADNIAPYGDSHFKFNSLLYRTLAYSTVRRISEEEKNDLRCALSSVGKSILASPRLRR